MTKFIVHAGTGTIIEASECLIFDIEKMTDAEQAQLTGDDYFDDGYVVSLAEQYGVPVNTSLPADTNYGNIISFAPSALREEAQEILGSGKYGKDLAVNDALAFVAYIATDEELQLVSSYILNDDALWAEYVPAVVSGALWGELEYRKNKEEK